MSYQMKFSRLDRVVVVDRSGNHLARGFIAGRYETRQGPLYDVQPHGEPSMSKRVIGVTEDQLRRVGTPRLVTGAADRGTGTAP